MSASRSWANLTLRRSSSSTQSRSIWRSFSLSSSTRRSWSAESSACWLRRAFNSARSRSISCDLVLTMLMSLPFSALRLPMRASLLAQSTFTSFLLSSFRRCVSSKTERRWNSSTSCISFSSLLLFSMSSSSRVFCCISPIFLCSLTSSSLPWRTASWCSSFLMAMPFCMMRSSLSLRWSLALLSSMASYRIFCSLSSIFRMWFRCTISLLRPMISAFSFSLATCHSMLISAIWLFLPSSCARILACSSSDCSRALAWFCRMDWKCMSCSWLKFSLREFICCALRQLPCSFSSLSRQISLMSSSIFRSQSLNFLCDSPMNLPFSNSIASSVIISARTCSSSFFYSATMIFPRSSSIAYSSAFSLARPWFFSTRCSILMLADCSQRFFSVSLGYCYELSLQYRLFVCYAGAVLRTRCLSLVLLSWQQGLMGEDYCMQVDVVLLKGDSLDIIFYYQKKQTKRQVCVTNCNFYQTVYSFLIIFGSFIIVYLYTGRITRDMNLKENQEIVEKIKKSGSLSNKMNLISQKFREFEQLALYTEADAASKDMIIAVRKDDEAKWDAKQVEKTNLHIIIGFKQPNGSKSIQKILLNLINLIPRPTQSYSVLYVNTLANGNAYSDFKKIMEFLPIEYFKHLEKIYVLHGNLKNKASYWMSFDYLTNYIKNKTIHLDTFKELVERIGINKQEFLHLLPAQVITELAKKEAIVKQIQQIKILKQNIVFNTSIYDIHEQEYVNKKPAVLTNQLKVEPSQKTIQNYEVGQTGAPLIIQLLISYFNGKQELLDSEGLFRKSVSIDEETSLLKQLSLQNYDCLESVTDPHLIANAIKRFLSNLAEPIIPYGSFDQLMEINQEKLDDCVFKVVSTLKNNRKMTILLLIDFLKEKLLPRTESNKMTENSLSIVLGPCLMHSEVPSMKDIVFTKKSIKATSIIFKNFEQIFGNAHERVALIRRSVRIQGRQTFKERLGDVKFQIQAGKQGKKQQIANISKAEQKDKGSQNQLLIEISQMMEDKINEQQQLESQAIFQQSKEVDWKQTSNNPKTKQK